MGATLTQSYMGWDYYSDGTVIDPDGSYYYGGEKVWSPSAPAVEVDAGGDQWISGLFGLAGKGLDIWAQKNRDGLMYAEGRPMRAQVPVNSSNTMLLLLGAGLLFVMAKA